MSELQNQAQSNNESQSILTVSNDLGLNSENLNQSPNNAKDEIILDNTTLLTGTRGLSLGNPDDYVFEFSDETKIDQELMSDFKKFAAQHNMSLDNAKQVAKFYENHVQTSSQNENKKLQELKKSYEQACINDEEFGGSQIHDNLRHAKAALARFDDGALTKILVDSGFGSHPEVVRFMYRVGKALAEKDMASGTSAKREPTTAELLYPSMNKSPY